MATYGPDHGRVSVTEVHCNGTESRLLDCTHTSVASLYYYSSYAGVSCPGRGTQSMVVEHYLQIQCQFNTFIVQLETCTTKGDVRLIGGQNEREGTIQICLGGVWGTVCGNYFDQSDAQVVCTQLGFPANGMNPILFIILSVCMLTNTQTHTYAHTHACMHTHKMHTKGGSE